MRDWLQQWFLQYEIPHAALWTNLSMLLFIVACALGLQWLAHKIVRVLEQKSRFPALRIMIEHKLILRLLLLLQGMVVIAQARLWLLPGIWRDALVMLAQLWCMLFIMLSIFSALNIAQLIWATKSRNRQLPLGGLFQTVKIICAVAIILLAISMLVGKSPLLLLSGLGAMSAVLMLVFKDPILGLVAGLQLSGNNMLKIGDWLQMDKYGADGAVIDIGLTTVKVRNWDNTVTTLPTYSLISESFKNWNAMSDSGGRRIKRSVFIDAGTVRFLTAEEIERLKSSRFLADYLAGKKREISAHNQKIDTEHASVLDGRHLTNLGTFRVYLGQYLANHPKVHKEMTCMVRQLQPSDSGIPLEIYCFANDVRWVMYENIQSDIFEHIYATVAEFGLGIFQRPGGHDLRACAGAAATAADAA